MEAKHTQGEWKLCRNKIDVMDGNLKLIFSSNTIDRSIEEAEANAKLIAAAPKLLEALKAIININGIEDIMPYKIKDAAYAAINSVTS